MIRLRGLDISPSGLLLDILGEWFGSQARSGPGSSPQGRIATQTRPNLPETRKNLGFTPRDFDVLYCWGRTKRLFV